MEKTQCSKEMTKIAVINNFYVTLIKYTHEVNVNVNCHNRTLVAWQKTHLNNILKQTFSLGWLLSHPSPTIF